MSLATSNAFAALDTKKKKKSKSKEDGGEKKKKQPVKTTDAADLEKAVFSQAKINVSNWADTDDDDDDFAEDFGGQQPWLQVLYFAYQPSSLFRRFTSPVYQALCHLHRVALRRLAQSYLQR